MGGKTKRLNEGDILLLVSGGLCLCGMTAAVVGFCFATEKYRRSAGGKKKKNHSKTDYKVTIQFCVSGPIKDLHAVTSGPLKQKQIAEIR